MVTDLIIEIEQRMAKHLDNSQLQSLHEILISCISERYVSSNIEYPLTDEQLIEAFISAKRVEGCSEKTLRYYSTTISTVTKVIGKPIRQIMTDDLRVYLATYQQEKQVCKVTIDNVRRIMSSFFSWLEDEDHIIRDFDTFRMIAIAHAGRPAADWGHQAYPSRYCGLIPSVSVMSKNTSVISRGPWRSRAPSSRE